MNIIIINDCNDENDKGRQLIRTKHLFKSTPVFIGIKNELEASGNIIDSIDALDNKKGAIIVNVAPRGGKGKNFENGSPFCYFWYKKILIISTFDGYTLSLIKKLNLIKNINLLDINYSLNTLYKEKIIKEEEIEKIKNSQFRSFDFQPRMAKYLLKHKNIKSKKIDIKEIKDCPSSIWWIDNFGNCKTILLKEDILLDKENKLKTKFGKLKYYNRLKDVPDNSPAIITGSSGIDKNRFLEIIVQGGSAKKKFNISSTDNIF